ncbi:MAG: hypothetical protein KKD01_04070 [Proteobacteria bacterium]|nr:hypothetical protein [Pseudomonadota bacterium]MBU1233749.1 hypothetical protein [Pseudomonadota bacterium]MBU1419254.1 hypothetical protein [Pseudomonadota bacterium]MBU1453882.1 hypothetical protein [Pseudomonadota bacterium]
MKFCKDCGGVLNLFGNNSAELCSSCIQHTKKCLPTVPETATDNIDLIGDAVLTYENGKIVLRSKEGWLLWSASGETQTELTAVLKTAKLIYEIRNKRKKKS